MKTPITLSFLMLSLFSSLFCQDSKFNKIGIEIYSPVITKGMRHFNNDNWLLSGSDSNKRLYTNVAFGLFYERFLKNDIFIRPRIGITKRKIAEESISERNAGNQLSMQSFHYKYDQKHINFFLGIGKKIEILPFFNLSVGFDITAIQYLSATDEFSYQSSLTQVNNFEKLFESAEERNIVKYGNAMNIGVGPIFCPEITTKKGVSFSMETQVFFMRTIAKSDNEIVTSAKITRYYDPEIAITDTVKDERYSTFYDLSQWSWSVISPLIRLGYQF